MGLLDVLRRLFWGDGSQGGEGSARGYGVEDLANRLGIGIDELRAVRPVYRQFTIPKRSGGIRTISAPDDRLKALQRRILRRLLDRLACHGAAIGFERGHSIVDNAMAHAGKAVVVCMDIKDFFGSTPADRVGRYFQAIGWNREVSALLVRLCTHGGSLPQGAPTSPRLGNLVNCRLDARLSGLATRFEAVYTRYADDLTFSFARDERSAIQTVIRVTKLILHEEGYSLHQRKKLRIYRRHRRQVVTGLVVNQRANLPRQTRRWLRAVEHHRAVGRSATLTPTQLAGWRAMRSMVANQTGIG